MARGRRPRWSAGDGDIIIAGHGRNIVFGDNGQIIAAAHRELRHPADDAGPGGDDRIADRRLRHDRHGQGRDIILGGIDADTIVAGDGDNIVIGDSGIIDWTAGERGGTLAGDDATPSDIDRIFSTEPDHGGNDTITTGDGDDIIIGGEDGEIVIDVKIDGHAGDGADRRADDTGATATRSTPATAEHRVRRQRPDQRGGTARTTTGHLLTLGLVESIESLIGGSDVMRNGTTATTSSSAASTRTRSAPATATTS